MCQLEFNLNESAVALAPVAHFDNLAQARLKSNMGYFRYTDLPRSCPDCSREFSEKLYHRLFPRRLQSKAIACLGALLVAIYFLTLSYGVLALFVLLPAMVCVLNWPKAVHVNCTRCGWAQRFLVRRRA